jgi:hypothetical protein
MIKKQSKNYRSAVSQYRDRYGRDPPPGFKAWFDYAVAHESPIIDEFDTIYQAVSPFWKMSGSEVLQVMDEMRAAKDMDLWHCTLSGVGAKTRCAHPHRSFDRNFGRTFDNLLGLLPGNITSLSFFVNHLDEPRVLLPQDEIHIETSHRLKPFEQANLEHQATFGILTKNCAQSGRTDEAGSNGTIDTFGLPFLTNRKSAMDLCQHPEYASMHGLFMSPTSFRLIQGMVPILSVGAPSTMGDILYPSPAYMERDFRYDEKHDLDWDRKHNSLYWAGSTSGGYASDDHWRKFHRQRFVSLAHNSEGSRHRYLQRINGVVSQVKSTFLNSRLYDVALTRIMQCEKQVCRDQRAYFNPLPWADSNQALKSRLAFDVDGNGISGRYYKILASKSTPLKQTLLREWHDDRLIPWVHYVPVSQSMEELPELVFYLTSTDEGQVVAKKIAEQGRAWYSRAFRDVDMSIYVYRLLLELARIQDPKRKAG